IECCHQRDRFVCHLRVQILKVNAFLGRFTSNIFALRPNRPLILHAIALVVTGKQWNYDVSEDKMDGGTTSFANVYSTNTVNFDFPYSGLQNAKLTLRTGYRQGKDVIFSIRKGQILCPSYQDCTVLVRFDDEKPVNYSAAAPADNSSETIFLRNYEKFLGKLQKAKRVRMAVDIFQEGAPVFEFDVSGFDRQQYQPKK
ncbi:hypothetical protein, partial [Janthinobacterium sp. DSP2-3-3]|uniref:hypothetical protein n=1 Tax=Janthinobacterium sp. DSP2-3-3 TaxID=2804596 RepID=UPI003CF74E2D